MYVVIISWTPITLNSEWFKTARDLQHQKPCVTVYPKLTIAEGKNKVKSELVKNAIKLRG